MQPQDSFVAPPSLELALDRSSLIVKPETLLVDVLSLMNTSSGRHCPGLENSSQPSDCVLVMDGATLLGILTEHDVIRLLGSGWVPSRLLTIAEVMTQPVFTLTLSAEPDVSTALCLLRHHQIRHLPVFDSQGQLLGIITPSSLLAALQPREIPQCQCRGNHQPQENAVELAAQPTATSWIGQQEFLRSVIDTDPNLIFVKDWNGNFILANQALADVYETTVEALVGHKDADFNFNSAEFEQYLRDDQHIMTTLQPKVIPEETISSPSGKVRWLQTIKKPLLSPDGQRYILGVSTDITGLKQAKVALQQTNEQLQAVLDAVPGFISWMSVEGRYLGVNKQLAESFNLSPGAFVGQELGFLKSNPNFSELMRQFLASSEMAASQVLDTYINGSVRNYLLVNQKYNQGASAVSVGIDITERKQAEAALLQSEERFRAIFEQAAVGIAQVSIEGQWLRVNQKLCEIIGYSREELLELNFHDITYPDDLEADLEYVRQILADEIKTYSLEKRYICKDQSLLWINLTVSLVRESTGEPKYFIIVIQDISDRQQAEAALQASEAKFRHIYENSPVMMHSIDESGKLCNVNGKWLEETGYTREEVLGQSASFLMTEESAQRAVSTVIPQFWHEGYVRNIPYQYLRKDGTVIDILLNCDATIEPSGRHVSLSVARNVTEQKRAELALQQLNEQLEIRVQERTSELAETIVVLETEIAQRQLAEQALEESQLCLKLLNRISTEITTGIPIEAVIPRTLEQISQTFPDFRVAYSTIDAQGCLKVVHSIEPPGMLPLTGLVVDLTIVPDYLNAMLEKQPQIIADISQYAPLAPLAGVLLANGTQAVLDIPLCHTQELVGLLCFDSPIPCEWSLHETNTLMEIADYLSIALKEAHAQQERQRAEAALRESQERLQAILDNSPAVIYLMDADNRFLLANRKYDDLFHISREQIIGKSAYEIWPPEIADAFVANNQQVFTSGKPIDIEEVVPHDDELHTYYSIKFPLRDAKGSTYAVCAISTDITERQQAQEALRQSELRLRIALNAAQMGTWDWNITTGQVRWSDRTELIFGLELGTFTGRFEAFLGLIHPEDRNHLTQKITNALIEESPYEVEARIYHSDGNIRWIASKGDVMRDSTGKPAGMAGVIMDITQRKQVEEALKESEEKFRRVFEDAPIGMMLKDLNGNGMQVNPAFCKMLGYTEAELKELTLYQWTHPEDLESEIPDMEGCFPGEISNSQMEKRYIQKNGEILWTTLTRGIIRDSKGNLRYGLKMVEDITERRRVEETLRLRDRAIAASSNGITIADARLPDLPMSYVNPAFERMTGYSANEVLGKNCRFLQNAEIHQPELDKLRTAIQEKNDCTVVLRNYRKDGTLFWNELSISPIYDPEGTLTHFIGIQTDITERKQAEEALQHAKDQLQAVLDAVPGFVAWVNSDLRYEGVNRHLAHTFNLTPDAFVGQELNFHKHSPEFAEFMGQFLDGSEQAANQVIEVQVNDCIHNYLMVAQKYQKGGAAVLVGIDISDRQRVEEQLKTSLQEKEVLLKEIHHRVKNNLQIISSLLKLQSGYINDEKALALFTDSYNRVRSMALIHENLYQSLDLAKIELANYIKTLATNLAQSYKLTSTYVKLQVEVDEMWLDIDTAIPCGLIINELVSNSLKYAFRETEIGEIKIQFSQNEADCFQLKISDNGIGLAPDFDIKKAKSLGLKLVYNLTKQLGGDLDFYNQNGMVFEINFTSKIKK